MSAEQPIEIRLDEIVDALAMWQAGMSPNLNKIDSAMLRVKAYQAEIEQLRQMLGAIVSFIGLPVEYDVDLNALLEQARDLSMSTGD